MKKKKQSKGTNNLFIFYILIQVLTEAEYKTALQYPTPSEHCRHLLFGELQTSFLKKLIVNQS